MFAFTKLMQAMVASGTVSDPQFYLTTLLLNTSSTNGAQNNTFIDSSTNNFTITRNGNATQGTFTPFSQTGWSNYFNGSYLTTPSNAAFAMGTGDFTIETFAYYTSFANVDALGLSNWNGSSWSANNWSFHLDHATQRNKVSFWVNNYSSAAQILLSTTTIALNTWYHIAVTRSGNTWRLFVNGALEASATSSVSLDGGISPIIYIAGTGNTTQQYIGNLSNTRIVKGTAVYTSAFTAPTTPLTAISGTSLLTCQSNRFADSSTNAFALTINGTPSVQAFSPFAPAAAYDSNVVGGSGYFDGSGDYLTFTDSANDLDLGGLVASFEAWVYPTSTANYQHLIYKSGGALSWSASNGIEYAIAFDVNKFYFVYNVSGAATFINGAATRTPNQWYHVAVATDASNNIALFVNGVREGTAVNAITKPATRTTINVGANPGGTETIYGYICGQRFIKGSGAYDPTQTTLTIPTAPPTAVTNTKLLLNFTNAGIYDSASKNVLETVGNAQVSTTQSKWGTTAMYFDGTGDWLSIPASGSTLTSSPQGQSLTLGSGNFTIEFWMYSNNFSGARVIVNYGYEGTTQRSYLVYIDSSSNLHFAYSTNGSTSTDTTMGSTGIATGSWIHIAIVRNGSTVTGYVNGTALATTVNISTNTIVTSTGEFTIGSDKTNSFNGYIDDLRITKGYARYTSNFTAPTAAFSLQ